MLQNNSLKAKLLNLFSACELIINVKKIFSFFFINKIQSIKNKKLIKFNFTFLKDLTEVTLLFLFSSSDSSELELEETDDKSSVLLLLLFKSS